ncbi:MAG TPA: hypothetical protein VF261_01680 [Candidatus Saccharimonadales bacterium]
MARTSESEVALEPLVRSGRLGSGVDLSKFFWAAVELPRAVRNAVGVGRGILVPPDGKHYASEREERHVSARSLWDVSRRVRSGAVLGAWYIVRTGEAVFPTGTHTALEDWRAVGVAAAALTSDVQQPSEAAAGSPDTDWGKRISVDYWVDRHFESELGWIGSNVMRLAGLAAAGQNTERGLTQAATA